MATDPSAPTDRRSLLPPPGNSGAGRRAGLVLMEDVYYRGSGPSRPHGSMSSTIPGSYGPWPTLSWSWLVQRWPVTVRRVGARCRWT